LHVLILDQAQQQVNTLKLVIMELQQIKESLNKINFSPESLILINEIMDEAIKNDYLTNEAKNTLLGIIDIEIEMDNIEEETLKDISISLEGYMAELDKAGQFFEEDIQKAKNNFNNSHQSADNSDTV
jgi:hypothetical protein